MELTRGGDFGGMCSRFHSLALTALLGATLVTVSPLVQASLIDFDPASNVITINDFTHDLQFTITNQASQADDLELVFLGGQRGSATVPAGSIWDANQIVVNGDTTTFKLPTGQPRLGQGATTTVTFRNFTAFSQYAVYFSLAGTRLGTLPTIGNPVQCNRPPPPVLIDDGCISDVVVSRVDEPASLFLVAVAIISLCTTLRHRVSVK